MFLSDEKTWYRTASSPKQTEWKPDSQKEEKKKKNPIIYIPVYIYCPEKNISAITYLLNKKKKKHARIEFELTQSQCQLFQKL